MMALGILGEKLGMMTWFDAQGRALAATVIRAEPAVVTQVKTPETDGYSAVQLGYGPLKEKNVSKPLKGHFNKAGVSPKRVLCEFRLESTEAFQIGQTLNLGIFQEGERVDVSGTSKGKGFAGVMKRHDFKGGTDSHGTGGWHRRPGTIGNIRATGRVFKGHRMAGHMGHERVTVKNLVILKIDAEKNLLVLRGAVPGSRKGFVEIRKSQ